MHIVGLSGGIACGKSTVARELIRLGLPVIDCDELAKETTRKGGWGYKRLLAAFGDDILDAGTGEIDREKLASIAFEQEGARKRLNQATHVPIASSIGFALLGAWVRAEPVVVVDMPLLFEAGCDRFCGETVVVTCDADQQIERAVKRGMKREDAEARVRAQMPLEVKRQKATRIIKNDGDVEDAKAAARALADRLKSRSRLRGFLTSPWGIGAAICVFVRVFR
ncbi:unnamed protein product [Pedinophyceae sp. YPF-701]|nr:unnamed protein product [Pedinophyceae sp. YPF-701]